MDESERRATGAESRALALHATIDELRSQNQKVSEDFAKVGEQLTAETSARVKAETQLAEPIQRLQEEKNLVEKAKENLTDTFKALTSAAQNSSTTEFLKLAKDRLDKVLTDARGDLGRRQEAIQSMANRFRTQSRSSRSTFGRLRRTGKRLIRA